MHSAGSWPISQVVWLQLVGVPAAGKCAIRCCWGSARVVGAFSDFGDFRVRTRKTGASKLSAYNYGATHLALQYVAEFRGRVASTVVHFAWSGFPSSIFGLTLLIMLKVVTAFGFNFSLVRLLS